MTDNGFCSFLNDRQLRLYAGSTGALGKCNDTFHMARHLQIDVIIVHFSVRSWEQCNAGMRRWVEKVGYGGRSGEQSNITQGRG